MLVDLDHDSGQKVGSDDILEQRWNSTGEEFA